MKDIHNDMLRVNWLDMLMFSATLIQELVKEIPNNQALGSKWRSMCIQWGSLDEFCLKYPNDFDLGKFLRKNFNKSLVN